MTLARSTLLEETAHRVALLPGELRRLAVLFGDQSDRAWVDLDLSMAQLKVCMALLASGGMQSSALAQRFGVRPSAITPLVDKLEALKLARREPDPHDRRVTWVRPTSKATALRDRLLQANRRAVRSLLDDVATEDLLMLHKSLELLARLLQRAAAVDTGTTPAPERRHG